MPYKSSKIKIAGTSHDRRIKLTEVQKIEIKRRYETENISQRKLAKEYNVSRGLIRYIIYPEKLEKNKQALKIRKQDGRYKPTPEKWAATIRDHRKYKQNLYKQGQIRDDHG